MWGAKSCEGNINNHANHSFPINFIKKLNSLIMNKNNLRGIAIIAIPTGVDPQEALLSALAAIQEDGLPECPVIAGSVFPGANVYSIADILQMLPKQFPNIHVIREESVKSPIQEAVDMIISNCSGNTIAETNANVLYACSNGVPRLKDAIKKITLIRISKEDQDYIKAHGLWELRTLLQKIC